MIVDAPVRQRHGQSQAIMGDHRACRPGGGLWLVGVAMAWADGIPAVIGLISYGPPTCRVPRSAAACWRPPFPSGDFPPLSLAAPRDEVFTLIGFDRMAPDLPARSDDCMPVSRMPGLLGLGCAVASGNSGAPLLQWAGPGLQVVAARGG